MNINKNAFILTAVILFISQAGSAYAMPGSAYAMPSSSPQVEIQRIIDQVYPESPGAQKHDIENIALPGGRTEWQAVEPAGAAVVSFAKGFLGCRYVYGASGPKTFDCSGFTMYVMGRFGIKLPHSATAQSLCGTGVSSREDLIPGDLVFFNTIGPRRIGHAGIYIGGGKFIHAGSYGVAVNSFDEAYYKKRYVTGTRVLK